MESLQVFTLHGLPLEWKSHTRKVDLTTEQFARREKYTEEQIKAATVVDAFKQVAVVKEALQQAAQGTTATTASKAVASGAGNWKLTVVVHRLPLLLLDVLLYHLICEGAGADRQVPPCQKCRPQNCFRRWGNS